MSYRDLRNFTEMMRALGYPRLISMENFRKPNFALVAEILLWLVKRFEPTASIHSDTDTQQDRVLFIRSVTEFMAIKSHLKLNSKKLYQADGYAVKELLKITSVLYNVMKTNEFNSLDDTESNESGPISFDISSKIVDLKEARKLASEITLKGATLYDLLAKETDLQESRSSVIARPLEINEVEKGINASMKIVQSDIQKTVAMLENIAADESTLDNKIEKRKIELDRNQKRLQTLQNVRPAYMDEYERLEQELEKLYEAYIIKFRNLTYLEQQLEEYSKMEQDKVKENQYALKSTAEALRQVERDPKNIFDEDDEDDDFSQTSDVLDSGSELDDSQVQRPIRPVHSRTRPEGASLTHSERKAHVQGSMFIDDSEDESGSDSDIDLDNNEGDLDDDEDIEIAVKSKTAPSSAVLRHKMIEEDDDSDNDF
ncbi:clusterin-associated protein 1 [Octopus bimaculoides]|uniref:Clusterin-associated protein 1 n=1 Tax=Octopus bimaculoides TaxID=37653 RepID=A0A0L8G3R0_OCTBM|nr:clusterin-associated protein 1 [Octopus bimaculoides]|eukprot:XP_014784706.1 PREDICTED: clusterin-associated protein 1-like [Octopus bimaculoides]